ncbi:hypothetical protein RUM43_001899 [Polyplax serrata]|uniref:Uncharacterized protein n=1 Tax=Polyplax serrata TaxID=468196 RepID=A0AAN8SG76_POLSC
MVPGTEPGVRPASVRCVPSERGRERQAGNRVSSDRGKAATSVAKPIAGPESPPSGNFHPVNPAGEVPGQSRPRA